MSTWNALPWNTIGIIIGSSLLISSLFTILLIKIKKYEELGWVMGVFLIFLSSISFLYLIPQEIIQVAVLPGDYKLDDEGYIYYLERNCIIIDDEIKIPSIIDKFIEKRDPIEMNFVGKEVIHIVESNHEDQTALIHDALYNERGEVFRVINKNDVVNEWYEINPKLYDLKYVNVEGGHMGIPSDTKENLNEVRVGWVESNGTRNGEENVVLIRDMKKIKTGHIKGVEVSVWQSEIFNTQITWHGELYICDETLRLTVHPKTGYVVHVYRHLMLYGRLSQFFQIYNPELLDSWLIERYLKNNNPIGEAAELIYETTDDSLNAHIDEIKGIESQMTYIPIIICLPMFVIGLALIWRYAGRSYYWKRYKDFETYNNKQNMTSATDFNYKNSIGTMLWIPKTILVVFIIIILLMVSFTYIINSYNELQNDDFNNYNRNKNSSIIDDIPPTPPGSNSTFDSGRHVLTARDEAAHKFSRREWWYFNAFFNDPVSDLQNWSMIVSFNKMAFNDIRYNKRDNLFFILYDDTGECYKFNIFNKIRGTLKSPNFGSGIDVEFQDSWIKGLYPTYYVHLEDSTKNIDVDLKFTADFAPTWVEGRSANIPIIKHFAGDYYIARCNVEGEINWNGKEYSVFGTGYHDHVWETFINRRTSTGWDWLNLHFDNGWEMYISKFYLRFPKNAYCGSLIINPDNDNLVEWDVFEIDYTEIKTNSILTSIKYPTKYHLVAKKDDMFLELDITVYNVCELIWRLGRTGMFEGPCTVEGSFSWSNYKVDLNGYGMTEVTRVKYLL